MGFTVIDCVTWERREFLEFFKHTAIYITVQMDITSLYKNLKQCGLQLDFSEFYKAFVRDYAEAEACGRLLCDHTMPENVCGVSYVPGKHFSAFSFSRDAKTDFIPFSVFGRFVYDNERILLRVCGEFSHAENDCIHISRFFEELESRINGVASNIKK